MDIDHLVTAIPRQRFFQPGRSRSGSPKFDIGPKGNRSIKWRLSPRLSRTYRNGNDKSQLDVSHSLSRGEFPGRRAIPSYQNHPHPISQSRPFASGHRSATPKCIPPANSPSLGVLPPQRPSQVVARSAIINPATAAGKNGNSVPDTGLTSSVTHNSVIGDSRKLSVTPSYWGHTRALAAASLDASPVHVSPYRGNSMRESASHPSHPGGIGRFNPVRCETTTSPKFVTANRAPALAPQQRTGNQPKSEPDLSARFTNFGDSWDGSAATISDRVNPGEKPSRSAVLAGELWLDTLSLRDWISSFLSDGLGRAASGKIME